jgi:predicted nucleic acid-binding Zn ribbon protein
MPIYDITCPCGNAQTLDQVRDGGLALCDECGAMAPRSRVYHVAFQGEFHTASSEFHSKQLGQTFASRQAFERHLEENNMFVMSDAERQDFKDTVRSKNDDAARAQGYRDREDRLQKMANVDHARDSVAAARERVAKNYASAHGSEGRASADSDVWKDALPGTA